MSFTFNGPSPPAAAAAAGVLPMGLVAEVVPAVRMVSRWRMFVSTGMVSRDAGESVGAVVTAPAGVEYDVGDADAIVTRQAVCEDFVDKW